MPKKVIPPTPAENTSPVSVLIEGREPDPAVLDGDIDSRMDALLKDHQEMGARPTEASGDAHESDYPLREKGSDKKAAKKK